MMCVVLVEVYTWMQIHQNMIEWNRSLADVSVIALVSTEQCWHMAAGELAHDKVYCSSTKPPMCYLVTRWCSTLKVNAIIEM